MVEFPFEFRALEVALEGICSSLDAQTRELEVAAYPALDELTAKVMSQLTVSCSFLAVHQCIVDFSHLISDIIFLSCGIFQKFWNSCIPWAP